MIDSMTKGRARLRPKAPTTHFPSSRANRKNAR